ncbi:demethylmenaquinone methyltransferase/2-methoxy-6-polyprenyl-1,4-benzoquinol methylase [Yoonia maricola]|uniref:Demethylmenaquinone methyltransferase/2-methoxy-6-polyprenyl-1,4-benzoquinol methylase n=1 Tax=Yoonia maricola TaxID=420999 RepID=A0A2M8W253_9RHOB|nr:class I SAM-dependent methyltransferase [Yoonia maricola]PJI85011.1 demethylmenaquinone methyltransferase/2-methoxy-6-polyprenyl-1,4-benzoquinol methylase [Yoonia maricola]
MTKDIYDPAFVADLFDRCSSNYRWWSAVTSLGFIERWRKQCVALLQDGPSDVPDIVDLMAGTGEVWPHLLVRFPKANQIIAVDISHQMHVHAVARLHADRADQITHIEANALQTDLPAAHADMLISTFGLKTFNADQQRVLARQIARILKPGGQFALIEASDPKSWVLRPFYRFYLDRMLPLVERLFLKGAQDFSMIGTYTRNFRDCGQMADALRAEGLDVNLRQHFFGCASSVSGKKPIAGKAEQD